MASGSIIQHSSRMMTQRLRFSGQPTNALSTWSCNLLSLHIIYRQRKSGVKGVMD